MKGRAIGFVYKGNGNVPVHRSIEKGVLKDRQRKGRRETILGDGRTSRTGNSSVERGIEEISLGEENERKIGRKK